MAVTVAASLLSGDQPQRVQVAVSGMASGARFTVSASAGDEMWDIPGGVGVSDGSTLLLVDTRSPLGVAVTYTAVVAGASYLGGPVTVPWDDVAHPAVVQSLDGRTVVPVAVADWSEPSASSGRTAFFSVAGSPTPVGRWDLTVLDEVSWPLETDDAVAFRALESLLRAGAPVVRRTVPSPAGSASMLIVQPTKWGHRLVSPLGALRSWSVAGQVVADPRPGVPLAGLTWDDFDVELGSYTWTGFDSLFASSTWQGFDLYDWTQL